MNHLDEGTIHAWLDGAVDATQAREIEAHIAQCRTCSAAVAEARGLVAASSRILNALDDVPAGVMPKRAVAPKRQWRAARWVTSIAAALMLAIGITTWNRGAVQNEMPALRQEDAVRATSQTVAPVVATTSAVGPQAAPAAPAATGVQDRGVVTVRKSSVPSGNRAEVAEKKAAAVPAPLMDAAMTRAAAGSAAPAPAAPSPPSVALSQEARSQDVLRRRSRADEIVVAAPGSGDVFDEALGCYRLPMVAGSKLRRVVGAASGAVGAAATAKTATSARAPARVSAAAAAPAAADFASLPAAMVRLDTVRQPLGYVVRSAASDSTVGWWSRWGNDSVRVDMLAAGIFTFALKDRATCPER